jgi:hypothetical protein
MRNSRLSSSPVDRCLAVAVKHRYLFVGTVFACCAFGSARLVLGEAPSFQNDVMPVFSKAGCNLGTCHGNQNGKGGFKLSLRGQNPAADYLSISHDQFGRRVNVFDPSRSLILLKPTMQVAHQGGLRFKRGSPEYETLQRWIEGGLPADTADSPRLVSLEVSPREQVLTAPLSEQQIVTTAIFSDGHRRDVTNIAVYETSGGSVTVSADGLSRFTAPGEATVLVRYQQIQQAVRLAHVSARPDFACDAPPASNYIDEHIFAKLRSLRINPSRLSSDTEFLRRAFLDTLGILPTAQESRQFVADSSPGKRTKAIDALLARPEFADNWALKWSDLLRNEEKVIDPTGVKAFHNWIRDSLAQNKPLNQFVRELVSARGSTYENPPANYYRANRDPISRAEATAQLFLGIRLQCAKCHNHPFDRWTQDDYYRWAALFARVDYKIVKNNRPDDNDKHQFDGEQIVLIADKGDVEDPRTRQAALPKFLGADGPNLTSDADRLTPVAQWLTSADNELFVRSQVNRIWYHLLGRGLVEPIDDFRATNPAVNPPLLDALAKDFVAHGFDLRYLVRTIMQSHTYQSTSEPNDSNRSDEINFSHSLVRRLSAEQMLDALVQVTGGKIEVFDESGQTRAGQAAGVGAFSRTDKRGRRKANEDEKFLKLFGKPPRLLTCECERSTESTLAQAFEMLSGPTLNRLLAEPENRLTALLGSSESPKMMIDELYWSALARGPSEEELKSAVQYFEQSANWRSAIEDITWSLVNSKEFLLRR